MRKKALSSKLIGAATWLILIVVALLFLLRSKDEHPTGDQEPRA
jgi:hypothetical protein